MPKTTSGPENWPPSLPYLSTPILSPSLPKDILSTIALSSPSIEPNVTTIPSPTTPYINIKITPITNPSHPACGQAGLYTTRAHPPDSFICLYLGLVHDTTNDQSSPQGPKSDYDLSLDRDLGLAIDADKMGNEARFINDYRGISDRPNAEFRDVIIKLKGSRRERGVGVFVKSAKKAKNGKTKREDEVGIPKGVEILVSYGRGFWSARRIEAEVEDEGGDDT